MGKYTIKTLNGISESGLEKFGQNFEINENNDYPNGIILRSAPLHDMDFPDSLHCIARAGAGVNNIPVEKCTEKGIVVFNTPGANANAVKELAIAAMLLSARKIVEGINWTRSLTGNDVAKQVEKGKAQFVGPEIRNKKLGVIGLGAIGVMVANAAVNMEMEVYGFDPYISVDHAWGLSRAVKKANDLKKLFKHCDYITLHIPLTGETKAMLNKEAFAQMKEGVRIINLSRGELVNDEDIVDSLLNGSVSEYVTDFPNEKLINVPGVIAVPHLGASTPESENNCAVMAVLQTKDFLENGNIRNSVNYPACDMGISIVKHRLTIAHRNIPKMLGQISAVLAEQGTNIANMINRSRGDFAYTMVDLEEEITDENVKRIKDIVGVLKVRVI
ncbi:MAG: phosphoglycerate dehydrogenase [Bacteroidia bacterium]|nr:phosphoglycerate dehydrogenase [Bacteroidia bacterium]